MTSQIQRVCFLLDCIHPDLPANYKPIVLTDRGIGTSPALFEALDQRGWRVLFRITDHAKIQRKETGEWEALSELGVYNRSQHVEGTVFKKHGQVEACVFLYWEAPHSAPWCLLSNDPNLDPRLYKQRWWIEAMFRDWKSSGLEWEKSRLWKPERADVAP